jgi:serine/threonine-protein kinase
MELEFNTLLKDRYLIEKQLGKGGMGTVYLATDKAVERKVAVKANLNPSTESTRQFEREARLLAALRHPNLPLVTDHFTLEDVQYLVMDFAPGDDLANLIKTEGAQSVDVVLEWAKQLGDALTYLHSQIPAVIHRDIKPGNIKITPKGQVILVDFGIAKASESGATTVGARGCTPGYAPPEQYGGASTGPYSDQ